MCYTQGPHACAQERDGEDTAGGVFHRSTLGWSPSGGARIAGAAGKRLAMGENSKCGTHSRTTIPPPPRARACRPPPSTPRPPPPSSLYRRVRRCRRWSSNKVAQGPGDPYWTTVCKRKLYPPGRFGHPAAGLTIRPQAVGRPTIGNSLEMRRARKFRPAGGISHVGQGTFTSARRPKPPQH